MKRIIGYVLCGCLLLSGCGDIASSAPEAAFEVLIDAGHGGFDGGAVAADGTNEKHLNLAIALCLRDMLCVCGLNVALTRDTDAALDTAAETSIHSRKVSDMQNRLALYRQAQAVLAIHQNKFDIPKYRGTQVFYSGNHPDGVTLADAIRTSVLTHLQPDNNRAIKKAGNGIYLLQHTTVPTALVECGFLSNPEELQLLKQPDYQRNLAMAIALGYWQYRIEQ